MIRLATLLLLAMAAPAFGQVAYVSDAEIASGANYTRGAGTNRVVVCALMQKDTSSTQATYNSVAKSPTVTVNDGNAAHTAFYVWNEAEGTNSASAVTITGGTATGTFTCATFQNVNQTTPIGDTDSTIQFSVTSMSLTLTTTAGDMAVVAATTRNSGGLTAWSNGESQMFDGAINAGGAGASAYLLADGASETVGGTFAAGLLQMTMAAIVLQQNPGGGGSEIAPLAYRYYQQGN